MAFQVSLISLNLRFQAPSMQYTPSSTTSWAKFRVSGNQHRWRLFLPRTDKSRHVLIEINAWLTKSKCAKIEQWFEYDVTAVRIVSCTGNPVVASKKRAKHQSTEKPGKLLGQGKCCFAREEGTHPDCKDDQHGWLLQVRGLRIGR